MGTIKIVSRWNASRVLYECEASTVCEALKKAVAAGANLSDANLSDANLGGADLSGANLRSANLSDANLSDANLSDAYLSDANLRSANLSDANLSDANLRSANLSDANLRSANLRSANLGGADLGGADLGGADLRSANLSDANLSDVKADLFKVLDAAPREVLGLLGALRVGHIDGSTYTGPCACLVGTIANTRGVGYGRLGIEPDSGRPAERWFLGIRRGDTPTNSEIARITEEWIVEWIAAHPEAKPSEWWRAYRHGVRVADGVLSRAAADDLCAEFGGTAIRHVTAKATAE